MPYAELWTCHQCGNGPMGIPQNPACSECGHRHANCGYCSYTRGSPEGGDSNERSVRGVLSRSISDLGSTTAISRTERIMSFFGLWTCCQCEAGNVLALNTRCPLCSHDKCANCSPAGDGSPTETGGEELRYSESTSLHGVDDTNIDDGRSSSKTERSRAWVVKRWLAQLGVMEKPLGPGEVRVRWKCCCGIRLFDDYLDTDTDGLREVQHFLDHSGEIREASNPAGQQPNGPATRNSWFSSFITPIINALSNPLRDRASQPSLPTHNSQSSQIPHGTASSIGPMLLLLCMSTGDLGIQLDQRCIKSLGSDRELFHFLQEVYFKRRGKLRSRFSLRMPIGVKFVEFSLLTSSYVDIHEHEAVCSDACRCLPPKILVDEAEYKYSPAPPKRSPPIGPTAMAHYLKNPSHVKERHVWILNQLPKKLKGELEEKLDDDVTGWGIHVEEGPNWGKVWLALMVVFISGSALFGILWSVFKQDVQGAFGISSWWISLCSLFLGYLATRDR